MAGLGAISGNRRETIGAISTLTGNWEYLSSTNHVLNTASSGGGGGNVNITQVGGTNITLGQTTMSGSFPVTIASDQSNIAVSTAVTSGPSVGQQTVNTTAVRITASSTVPTNGIIIGALSTNSASIFIGSSGVTTSTGAEITPGSSLPFTCNLNTLYIISVASTTDKIWWSVT